MKLKQILKIIIDIAMTVVLLLLMAYSLVGEAVHEWLGIGIFALFIVHHVLNSMWCRKIFQGKYTPFRVFQATLVLFVFLCMIGSMVSGIILSRYVFDLKMRGFSSVAQTVHMICAYWGFVFMSLHLGLHWNMMMGIVKRMSQKTSAIRARIVRAIGLLIAACGVYAFVKRDIGNYMLLRFHFAFFDFDEPLIFFLLDYMAAMGLFVFLGHYLSAGLRLFGRRKPTSKQE